MEIRIIEARYPQAHKAADGESRSLLIAFTGWSWIPWPWLDVFKKVLERNGIRMAVQDEETA